MTQDELYMTFVITDKSKLTKERIVNKNKELFVCVFGKGNINFSYT